MAQLHKLTEHAVDIAHHTFADIIPTSLPRLSNHYWIPKKNTALRDRCTTHDVDAKEEPGSNLLATIQGWCMCSEEGPDVEEAQ